MDEITITADMLRGAGGLAVVGVALLGVVRGMVAWRTSREQGAAAVVPGLLARLDAQDGRLEEQAQQLTAQAQRIDQLATGLAACESKHAAAEQRAEVAEAAAAAAEERAAAAEERAEEATRAVYELQSVIDELAAREHQPTRHWHHRATPQPMPAVAEEPQRSIPPPLRRSNREDLDR